jgi:GNAT superfamily N-acetyltransferase
LGIDIKQAGLGELEDVTEILQEASEWAEAHHGVLWEQSELAPATVRADIDRGEFFIARIDGVAVATLRYQLIDVEFWPESPRGEAAYVHRLAVRRRYAGRGIAAVLLDWAAERARGQGLQRLRLDADLSRPKLRALYERCGFREHSEAQVGPYRVMRFERSLGPDSKDIRARAEL